MEAHLDTDDDDLEPELRLLRDSLASPSAMILTLTGTALSPAAPGC